MNNNPVRYNDPTGHWAVGDNDESHNNDQCDDAVTDCDVNDDSGDEEIIFDKTLTVEELNNLYLTLSALNDYLFWGKVGTAVLGAVATTLAGIFLTPLGAVITAGVFASEYAELDLEKDTTSGLMDYIDSAMSAAKDNGGSIQLTVANDSAYKGGDIFPIVSYKDADHSYMVTSPVVGMLMASSSSFWEYYSQNQYTWW